MALKNNAREMYAEALESLLENNELKDITVLDIVKKCNSSRSTFYHYFKDKYDLTNWVYENFLEEYLNCQECEVSESWFEIQKKPLDFIYSKRKYFSKITKYKGQNSFQDFVFEITRDRALKSLQLNVKEPLEEQIFSINYMSAGVAKSIICWIENGFKPKPDVMAKYLLMNTPNIVLSFYEQ